MNASEILKVTVAALDVAYMLGTIVQASDHADEALAPLLREVAELRERLADGDATQDEVDAFVKRAMAPLDAAIERLEGL